MDWDIALQVLGYDGAAYHHQIALGSMRWPVITIVLYFGDAPWTGPLNLLGRVPVRDERLRLYLNDWHINLCQVAHLKPENIGRLTSDFKLIADCCVQRRLGLDYSLESDLANRKLDHAWETLELMALLTRDERFRKVRLGFEKGEDVTMHMVLDKMMNESEARGFALGKNEGFTLGKNEGFTLGKNEGIALGELNMLFSLVRDGLLPLDAAVSKSNMSEAEFRLRMARQKT